MNIYTRWAICYKHDGSPFGELYVHKSHAEKELLKTKNQNKFLIKQFQLSEL
jgi:hypothetical protein